jgi:hypothetical protein
MPTLTERETERVLDSLFLPERLPTSTGPLAPYHGVGIPIHISRMPGELFFNVPIPLAIERYTHVVRVTESLTPFQRSRFDRRVWGNDKTRCALGFCGADAWFNRQGFFVLPKRSNFDVDDPIPETMYPVYGRARSWAAVYRFFGVTPNEPEVHPIFEAPRTPEDVVAAVQAHVEFLHKLQLADSKMRLYV